MPAPVTDPLTVHLRESLYVDGRWRPARERRFIDVIDASTEQRFGRVPSGAPDDADAAVRAARRAQPEWAALAPAVRADFLRRIARGLERRSEEIATVIAREVGTARTVSRRIQAGLPVTLLDEAATLLDTFPFEEQVETSLVIQEPVGVVACITPWNFPLIQAVAKVASALAVGCTVVLKPSSEAPLSCFVLADVVDAVGLPPGVLNVVSGPGAELGEALASHPEVDMVSFTGSTESGRRVAACAARTVKRLGLELGGKSANLILDDADLERAIPHGVGTAFLNSGQTCSALTRMLVPRTRLAEAEEILVDAVERQILGDPLDDRTELGPLASNRQRATVREYIAIGAGEGARLITGGGEPPADLPSGYYVTPTVFSSVHNRMRIAQEEIFGPVLTLIPYEDEADGIRIANDTIYGLAAGVWSGDHERARTVARRLLAGQVNVNGGAFNALAPFGGFKQSGYGRERGKYGFDEFLEPKSLQL